MSIRLRSMTIKDVSAAVKLKDIAGWNQTAADWERFLSASPDGCFVAEDDGRVIGTTTTISYESKFAWIGMVLVDPLYRGRGIGTELLKCAISYLDSCSIPCLKLDGTPQGRPLYEKLGFVTEYEIERWMLKPQLSEEAVSNELGELGDVFRLDREIFGADRSGLLCSIAEEAPNFTLVTRQDDRIAGYVFGRRGSHAIQMGPWVARNREVAGTLLDTFLCFATGRPVFVDCVPGNPWAVPLVKARGFEFSRPLTRMFRGTNDHAERPDLLGAVLGPEFG